MLDNHDDDGDGEIGDTLITLIPAGSSILPPPGVSYPSKSRPSYSLNFENRKRDLFLFVGMDESYE